MSSSTFKGRYKECYTCSHQVENGGKFNCTLSHSKIRNNSNGVGIKYQRYFVFCGIYEKISSKKDIDV